MFYIFISVPRQSKISRSGQEAPRHSGPSARTEEDQEIPERKRGREEGGGSGEAPGPEQQGLRNAGKDGVQARYHLIRIHKHKAHLC